MIFYSNGSSIPVNNRHNVHTENTRSTRLNRSRRGIFKHGSDCYRNADNPRGNCTIKKLEMHVVSSQENGYHSNQKIFITQYVAKKIMTFERTHKTPYKTVQAGHKVQTSKDEPTVWPFSPGWPCCPGMHPRHAWWGSKAWCEFLSSLNLATLSASYWIIMGPPQR